MTIEAIFQQAIEDSFNVLGADGVFSPLSGDDVPCRIIVERGSFMAPGGTVQVADPRITISYKRSDIDRKVLRGETFTVGATAYTVLAMSDYPNSWTDFEGRADVEEA